MDATSVGQIGLGLVVNKKSFEKDISGISKLAKKTGAMLASAFAVKKIVDFGKQCIDLGSDLEEVQNVVDVTFPNMSAKVDEFAQKAAASFGLSETMAKQYTGTFGAMAKAFGFSEAAAYEMSTTLTGLAGDVASFYNLSQDEAYTKLKSVFTGETETLKDLGVVMTQTALDSYALANGYGKTTSAMSEAEKVSLRYAFVQDQLATATGDFARTSGSWANQVKLLQLQLQSFMATVGQGLINLFTPVIRVINTVIGKLMSLANAFKAFTELITGKSGSDAVASAGSTAAESLDTATDSADSLTDATNAAGDAAKSTAKKMRELMGFDKITKLSDNSDSSSGSGTSGGTSASDYDFGSLETGENILDETSNKFQKIIDKAKELAELFKTGFTLGIGDTENNLKRIQTACDKIGTTLTEIFTDQKVIASAEELADAVALSLGKITGAAINIGVGIATNLTEGIADSLDEKKEFIKTKLSNILTLEASSINLVGDLGVALGGIISNALTSDAAVSITSSIASTLTTCFLEAFELVQKLKLDIESMLITPIIDNKDKLERNLKNTLEPIATIFEAVEETVETVFDAIGKLYDEHIHPLFESVKEGLSDTLGKILDAYNNNIAPVLDKLAKKFKEVVEEHVQPALTKAVEALGPFIDIVKELWEEWLKPLVDWCVENIMPVLAVIFEKFGTGVLNVFADISDTISNVFQVIEGLGEILEGVITFFSDPVEGIKTAWEGVKNVFQGVWDVVSNFTGLSNISLTVKGVIDGTFKNVQEAFGKVKNSEALKTLKGKFGDAWSTIKNAWNNIKSGGVTKTLKAKKDSTLDKFKKTWDSLKEKTLNIKANVTAAIDNIKKLINEKIIAKLNSAITVLNKLPGVNVPKIPKLAQGGYVKRNTPQLAVIGDNMRHGEIVAPEDKLAAMAKQAASMSGGASSAEIVALLKQILAILQGLNLVATVDGDGLRKLIVKLINENTKANGYCEINM